MVFIPTIPVDPAGIQAAAGRLHTGGAAMAEQADTVVRTWTGLSSYYVAPEGPALFAALDPVAQSAREHRIRLSSVRSILDAFAVVAEQTIRELDMLRAQAATASPPAAALLEERALALIAQFHQEEQACAGDIRAAIAMHAGLPGALSSAASWLALEAGDKSLGLSLVDTELEHAMLTHFTNGTGSQYVLSDADLAALRADPAVQARSAAIRAGAPGAATAVTLEGGLPGFRADIDFRQPVPGRTVNPFDGSIGRGRVFFDPAGNVVGISDAYDFTNPGNAVDLVNLDAGVFGSRPFGVRGGVIQELPPDPQVPVQPDAGTAAGRLYRRNVLGDNPGSYVGPR